MNALLSVIMDIWMGVGVVGFLLTVALCVQHYRGLKDGR